MTKNTLQILSTQGSIFILKRILPCLCLSFYSHFLSLSSHTLSFSASLSPSPSLVYLLSQPRKSRDYQRNNPSTRGLLLPASAESLLFSPLLFPSVLSYFLSEAGGEDLMMGDIPLLVQDCKTSKHPPPFLVLSIFWLLRLLRPPPFSARSSLLVYHLCFNKTRPIGTHPNIQTVHTPPAPRTSCLFLIRVSSDWGCGCRPYTCPQINPAVWLGRGAAGASHPSFPVCPENRENNKVSLDPHWKSAQPVLLRKCPQAEGVKGWWKIIEGNCANFCFYFNISGPELLNRNKSMCEDHTSLFCHTEHLLIHCLLAGCNILYQTHHPQRP